jgi:hypothetical protein
LAEDTKRDDELNRARDKKTASTVKGAKAIENLATAAMKAAGSLYTTLPKSLSDVFGKEALAGSLNYIEKNLEAMRGFGSFGVNFANQVDDMIASASNSRIGLDGFAKIVGQSGSDLLTMGATANRGMNQFVANQSNFFEAFREDEKTLKRLGYTVDEITDTFLIYDKISNVARTKENRTVQERNRAAIEFSLELDKMAKLTGKSRESLANQMAEVSRSGDVQARSRKLGEDGQKSLQDALMKARELGPGVAKLTQDLLTAGIPKGESKRLMGLAGDYSSAVLALRDAQTRGNKEQIKLAEANVQLEAEKLRDNETIQNLALYSGVNQYTDIAASVLEDTATGYARALGMARAELEKEGIGVTAETLSVRVNKIVEAEQAAAIANAKTGSQKIQQAMIDLLSEAQRAAASAQITGTKEIIDAASGPIHSFAASFTQLKLEDKVKEFNKFFTDMLTGLGNLNNDLAARGAAAADEAQGKGAIDLARTLSRLSREYNESTGPEKEDKKSQLLEAIKKANELPALRNMVVDANNVTIQADELFIDNLKKAFEERGREYPNPKAGRDTGSLGKTGKLFENFGKQSNMLLHGIESVQTPEQTAEIMRHSAIGTAQAFADSLRGQQGMEMASYIKSTVVPAIDQMSGTTVQTLGGMLNTLKATSTTNNVANQNQQIDPAIMEQLFTRLASNIKGPMEEALKGLKSPMEDFASTAREQLAIQQKQLRGIKGMSGDAMRGLG